MGGHEILIHTLGAIALLFSIIGRIAMAHKSKTGFIGNMVCGALLVWQACIMSNWTVAIMCSILFVLDVYGLYCWIKMEKVGSGGGRL